MDLGTAQLVRAALRDLARHFHIRVPSFRFNRGHRGLYYASRFEVTVPRREGTRRRREHSVIHEFAHHLVRVRERDGTYGFFPKLATHGEEFRNALWEVAEAWYGDPVLYPWETEYDNVEKWATKRVQRQQQEKIDAGNQRIDHAVLYDVPRDPLRD